jgi:uncharacterized protein (DUF1499 family)
MLKTIFWVLVILAALVIALGFFAARKSTGMPAPGFQNGALPPCSDKPNCVSTEADPQGAAYIAPIKVPSADNTAAAMDQLQAHIKAMGGRIVNVSDNTLQAVFQTRMFSFSDDMLVVFDQETGVFRVRSSSRIGHSDLGANRKRVEALRQLITR